MYLNVLFLLKGTSPKKRLKGSEKMKQVTLGQDNGNIKENSKIFDRFL